MPKGKIKGSRKAVRGGVKKTSKRLATIAGKYVGISKEQFFWHYTHTTKSGRYLALYRDVLALAGSVLSQHESEQPKKKGKGK